MALAAAPDVPGFRALSPLGYGPTSTLYSAQSIALGRWVALTVYSTNLTDDRAQRRFTRAFETARRLGSHPHAVTMLECGLTLDRRPYVASEIYERGTLDGRVAGRKPLKIDEALHMGIAVAGALETAHRADVLHGGVHPARVLVGSDGEPALADLGLVPLVERGGLAALVGPMSYHTAPEVLEGEPVSPATDVYSLASTLYTVLTGEPPYRGGDEEDTVASLLLRILQHAVPPIDDEDVPQSLEWLLHQALSCEPKDRPERPLAFARALQGCQQELQLPPTEPVVLDIAANLRLAGGDDPADPLDDGGYGAGGSVASMLGASRGTTTPSVIRSDPPAGGSTVQRVFVPYTAPEPDPDPAEAPRALADDQRTSSPAFTVPVTPAPATVPSAFAAPPAPPSSPTPLFPPADPSSSRPGAPGAEPPLAPRGDRRPEPPAASMSVLDRVPPAGRTSPTDDGPGSSPWSDLQLDPPLVPGRFDDLERVDHGDVSAHGAPGTHGAPGAHGTHGAHGAGVELDRGPERELHAERSPAPSTPTSARTSGATSTSTSVPPGPRALPVLVLMGLVAVLVAGVSWMIATGEDPTQEEPAGTSSTSRAIEGSGSGSGSESGASGGAGGVQLTATENANGVQLDWEQSGSGNQVVLVLSVIEPPRALPAETGTALLVPSAGLQPQTGYCFAVATSEGATTDATRLASRLPTGAIPPAACIRGATDATVRRE